MHGHRKAFKLDKLINCLKLISTLSFPFPPLSTVTFRNNMFELADRLVGIYKTHDATKSVTINPRMFAEATTNKGERAKVSVSEGGGRQKAILGDATNIM